MRFPSNHGEGVSCRRSCDGNVAETEVQSVYFLPLVRDTERSDARRLRTL